MNNIIVGKLVKLLPTVEGESSNGKWIKGGFVIEYGYEYVRKAAFTVFGDVLVSSVTAISIGQNIQVTFTPESREYNDRWYTDLRCSKIDAFQTSHPVSTPAPQPQQPVSQPTIVPIAQPTQQPVVQQATLEMPKDENDLLF